MCPFGRHGRIGLVDPVFRYPCIQIVDVCMARHHRLTLVSPSLLTSAGFLATSSMFLHHFSFPRSSASLTLTAWSAAAPCDMTLHVYWVSVWLTIIRFCRYTQHLLVQIRWKQTSHVDAVLLIYASPSIIGFRCACRVSEPEHSKTRVAMVTESLLG